MSRSLIQTVNTNSQNVNENGVIDLGSVLRRFGCNCRLSGNAIELIGQGYYDITGSITASPTAEGEVTVNLYANGLEVPGATGTATATAAGDFVTIPIVTTVRIVNLNGADNLTLGISAEGVVSNVSLRVEKA